MRRGEIWVVGLDPAEGHEQKGRRPVLVISPDAFNQVTKVPVVLPITSGGQFRANRRICGISHRCRDENHRRYPLRPAARARSRRAPGQKAGKRTRSDHGRGSGEGWDNS